MTERSWFSKFLALALLWSALAPAYYFSELYQVAEYESIEAIMGSELQICTSEGFALTSYQEFKQRIQLDCSLAFSSSLLLAMQLLEKFLPLTDVLFFFEFTHIFSFDLGNDGFITGFSHHWKPLTRAPPIS